MNIFRCVKQTESPKQAAAEAKEDLGSVDVVFGRGGSDAREEDAADEGQGAACDVPGLKVAEAGREVAVGEDGGAQGEDEGEEADGCCDGAVASRELEV